MNINARRLAATETNIAYRTADYERWQQLDFVVGIQVQLSNNHNCKGVPAGQFFDICDELKGKYPKDFKFTGWHPHCRCIATTILKTKEEMEADDERILRGEEPADPSESDNAVNELPSNFNQWLQDNEERIGRAKSMPYFLSDNAAVIANDSKPRHLGAQGYNAHKPTKARELLEKIPTPKIKFEQETINYTRQQAEKIGAKMTSPMDVTKADSGDANTSGDKQNCQSAVVAFFARLLGMDVTAVKYDAEIEFIRQLENDQKLAYYISPTKKIHPTPSRKLMSVGEVVDYIENETAKEGIYNIAIDKWKDEADGHILCLVKHNGKPYLLNVQDGTRQSLVERLSKADFLEMDNKKIGVELLRIDKLVLSDEALQVLVPIK